MGYEVDFLGVGQESRSGDAIAMRFGNLFGGRDEQTVVVIDGGFRASGDELVAHIDRYYGTSVVDLVISTHPDADHVAGLEVVVQRMEVRRLWMHRPWLHTVQTHGLFHDGRVTANSVSERLQRSLEEAMTLEQMALARGIPITEPFAGVSEFGGVLFVVGPTREYYESLLLNFRSTPTPTAATQLIEAILGRAGRAVAAVRETLGTETLGDDGTTSAENNSSAVLYFSLPGYGRVLFTADAGIPALERVAGLLEGAGVDPATLEMLQGPHHGSKSNLGPTVLSRLVGAPGTRAEASWSSVISAAPGGEPNHPSKRVTNALKRRGARPYVTRGKTIRESRDAPDRVGWTPMTPEPFYDEVDG